MPSTPNEKPGYPYNGIELNVAPGNTVKCSPSSIYKNVKISVSGTNNTIIIGDKCKLVNAEFQVSSNNNTILIGRNVKYSGRVLQKITDGNILTIGDDTAIGRAVIINGEGTSIKIGRDCLLSFDIDIRSTDSHSIEDLTTGERINQGADIVIGEHVWIAARAAILKGVCIPSGCVVGINAVVAKSFDEPNAVIVGNPARVVRRDIRWQRPIIG